MVHEFLLRKTQMSSPLIPGCSINYCPLPNITPAIADCRYKVPLTPRLHGSFIIYVLYYLCQSFSYSNSCNVTHAATHIATHADYLIKLVFILSSPQGSSTPCFFAASIDLTSHAIFFPRSLIVCMPSSSLTTSSGVFP